MRPSPYFPDELAALDAEFKRLGQRLKEVLTRLYPTGMKIKVLTGSGWYLGTVAGHEEAASGLLTIHKHNGRYHDISYQRMCPNAHPVSAPHLPSNGPSQQQHEEQEAFERALLEYANVDQRSLPVGKQARKSMTRKYISYTHLSEDSHEINDWYRHCQQEKIPYVTVSARRKYANVQWDYINLPTEYDAILSTKGDEFIQGFQEIFKRYATDNSEYRVGNFVATFVDIEVEKAPRLAEDLFDYICRELKLSVDPSK